MAQDQEDRKASSSPILLPPPATADYIADLAGEMEQLARRSGFDGLAKALNAAKKEAARAARQA